MIKYILALGLFGGLLFVNHQLGAQEIKKIEVEEQPKNEGDAKELKPQSFKFETQDWKKVLKSAKLEKRIVFVHIMTKNCDACDRTINEIWSDPKLARLYSEKFLLFSPDTAGKEINTIISKYKITSFPTILFVDGNGGMVHKYCGFANESDMMQMAENVSTKRNTLQYYNALYKKLGRKMEPQDLLDYAKVLMHASMDNKSIVKAYFKTQDEGELSTPENIEMLMLYADEMYSREFTFFAQNSRELSSPQYSQAQFDEKIEDVISSSLIKTMKSNPRIKMEDTLERVFNYFRIEERASITSRVTMDYYDVVKPNRVLYFPAVNQYMMLHMQSVGLEIFAEKLQRIADDCDDQETLSTTIDVATEITSQSQDFNIDFYSAYIDVLVKANRLEEAEAQVNIMIDRLINTGISEDELEKIFREFAKRIDNHPANGEANGGVEIRQ